MALPNFRGIPTTRTSIFLFFFFFSSFLFVYLCFSLVTLNSKGCITKAELCLLGPSNETEIKSSAIYCIARNLGQDGGCACALRP